ncbi:MAG: hypothetical protein WKG07_06770 [Hymenobacter sp.]
MPYLKPALLLLAAACPELALPGPRRRSTKIRTPRWPTACRICWAA